METKTPDTEIASRATRVVDRLWRAYAPFQRGRDTSADLTSMLAILVLADFVETTGAPTDEFVKRWDRAVAEAPIGHSPLTDLRAAMKNAGAHKRFPLPDLVDAAFPKDDEEVPWAAAFLAALMRSPTLAEAGVPEVCELLIERHVQEGTRSAGEFYTPRGVVRLLIEMASPRPADRILDPACGSGGLLAAAARSVAESDRVDGASFEAYATDRSNPRLAMMNLALHGVQQPVVRASDPASLLRDRGSGVVDRVLSNPPFNQRLDDIRGVDWPLGEPPESNANFAWLQLAWARLSDEGLAAVIMPPRAAWSDNAREAAIRRALIDHGALLGIIALPPGLFAHTAIPVHIWYLVRDKSRHMPTDDRNSVLFIDAGRLGTPTQRPPRALTEHDVERISSRFREWLRTPGAAAEEPGFSRAVSHEEIFRNAGNLDPRRYVEPEPELTTPPDTRRVLDELDRQEGLASDSSSDARWAVGVCERLLRNGPVPSRVSLRHIVDGVSGGSAPGLLLAGPSGSLARADAYVDTGIPVVMPKDLVDNGFSLESIKYITEQHADTLDRYRLRRGDVLLARRGELGRCAVVRDEQHGWICGTGCFLLRPPTALDADYFAAYLRSPETRAWLNANSTGGMTMKTISLKVLGEMPVALPDLGAQQAIVAAVARLDEHERLLREQLSLTRELRRATLDEFLAGVRTVRP